MSTSRGDDLVELLTETIWKPYGRIDERCHQLTDAERTLDRVRHSLGTRLAHWSQVFLMTVLVVTGVALWTGVYGPMNVGIWDGYYVAFGLHMWAGTLILATTLVLFPFYHVFVDGHRQLAELSDVVLAINVGLAFVGLRDYPPNYHQGRRAWDVVKDHWMVGHPAQRAYFWWITIFVGAVAVTGFGMYREMALDPSPWVEALGFAAAWLSLETLKQLHFVVAAVVTSMVVFHAYFSVLPSNWDFLRSMVTGRLAAYEVRTGDGSTEGDRDD
jgi:formate dehydrogenase subunit gamma